MPNIEWAITWKIHLLNSQAKFWQLPGKSFFAMYFVKTYQEDWFSDFLG